MLQPFQLIIFLFLFLKPEHYHEGLCPLVIVVSPSVTPVSSFVAFILCAGLFEELIEVLDPDVIIMSCGKQIIDKRFSGVNKIYATGACSKFIYGFNWRPKKKGHAIKVICGRNMRGTPFGMITIGDGGNMKSLVRKLGK